MLPETLASPPALSTQAGRGSACHHTGLLLARGDRGGGGCV